MQELVMLPGWGFKASIFGGLKRQLRPEWRISLIDLCYAPAFTDKSLRTATVTALAQAPPRAIWLGWSLGGLVALSAAALQPEYVASVILVASTPRFLSAPDWPCGLNRQVLSQFQALLERDPQRCLDRFSRLVSAPDTGSLSRLRSHLAGPYRQGLKGGLALLENTDLRQTLRNMPRPVLALWGAQDAIVSAETAHQAQEIAPSLRSCMIQHAGHAPFLSHPKATAAAIMDYINGFH